MGTKVEIENYSSSYYPMKDLNHESHVTKWTSSFGESNLSNGQLYYGFLPRTLANSQMVYDKDFLRQTMLEHEAIFKNQVYELHRLYRVQRDLMDEVKRKEKHKRRFRYETSSSSSPIPSQMQYEDVPRWNGHNLPFTTPIYGRPLVLVPDMVQSSENSFKGKGIETGSSSFPNCYSPKNSESNSRSRPTKVNRRMLDLQLPAHEYIETDDIVRFDGVKNPNYTGRSFDKNGKFVGGIGHGMRPKLQIIRPKALADLNEPLLVEEKTSVDFLRCGGSGQRDSQKSDFSTRVVNTSKYVPQNPKSLTIDGMSNNVQFENRSNGGDWFGYALESGSSRSINQGICLEKKPIPSQSVHNQACQSGHVHYKPGSNLGQKPISAQRSPYLSFATVNWSPKSLAQSNDMFGTNKLNLNNSPSVLLDEIPVRNGFYESSSSFKGFDSLNSKLRDKNVPCSSINSYMAENCVDLNYGKGLNLNVDHKLEDPLTVLPWLKGKTARNNEVENSRKDLDSHDSSRKILGVPIFENPPTPNKEVSKAMIVNKESESSGRIGVIDINLPCDPTEGDVEILEEKTQISSSSFRHCFDLNSCVVDEEIPCEPSFSVPEKSTGIDLEGPVIIEKDEIVVVPQPNVTDVESELARSAASAIVAMSSYVDLNQSKEETHIGEETDLEDPLCWFVEIACSKNGNGLDDFEMMTLRQKECREEEYFPKPIPLQIESVEERETCVWTTTRTRKGNARKGRQKRDFQRDILPGLTSLSRHEVTKDLQMFGGLMREKGQPWLSSSNRRNTTRNGFVKSGRRTVRTTAAVMGPGPSPGPTPVNAMKSGPPAVPTLRAVPVKEKNVESKNKDVGVDDRSLKGWGKITRRPRRQRCPSGNTARTPIPLT